MNLRRLIPVLMALVVCLSMPYAFAQTESATVSGLITDPQNRPVPGVQVIVTNQETNASVRRITNDAGVYVVVGLQPGRYRLSVTKEGFRRIDITDLTLAVQDVLSRNLQLQVGSFEASITVTGEASNINTTDATVSTVVDQTYVKNMPLNGRSLQDLILLTPGITYAGGGTARGEFNVNGQRAESNYVTVDGVSANTAASADSGGFDMLTSGGISGSASARTTLGTTQALVSVDDLQEFRIQTSTYSAEYGRNPGGQIAFETKSGTNQFHGTVYDYLRNNFFDANDWFNDYFGIKQPALRQNDFGGTFGGPMRIPHAYNGKDKTFFFVSYEGLRLIAPQADNATQVPDLCMRGDASSCAALNAQYAGTPAGAAIGYPTSGRSPAGAGLLPVVNAFPLPSPNGNEDAVDGLGEFIGGWSNPSSIDSGSVRIDHTITDRAKLFFRFNRTDSSSQSREQGLFGATTSSVNDITASSIRTYTGGMTNLFTNRVSNEFRLNYTSNYTKFSQVIDSFGGAKPVDLGRLIGFPNSGPQIVLGFGGFGASILQLPAAGAQHQWNLVDSLSVAVGRHQFKFGVDYRRLSPVATITTPQVLYFYADEPSVEQNNAAFTEDQSFAPAYPLYKNFSAFADDEWKASQRLNLSFGLRWEVNPPPGVTRGLMPYTINQGPDPNTWAVAPQGTPLWRTTWYNFAPRLGAAYNLHNAAGFETVIRGGAGVFFDTGQQLGSYGFAGPGFSGIVCCPSGPFPGTVTEPPIAQPDPSDPTQVYDTVVGFATFYSRHLQLPYTIQWNASIDQGLGTSQALSVSYVGSHASRLLEQDFISAPSNPHVHCGEGRSRNSLADIQGLQSLMIPNPSS